MTNMKAKYMAIVLTMPHSMDLEEPASCAGGDGAAEVGGAAALLTASFSLMAEGERGHS
jgi:hypothetical protein